MTKAHNSNEAENIKIKTNSI